MKPAQTALGLILLAFACFALAILTSGCAVTYPGKHGNVTFEFSPTPEMLDMAGLKVSRTLGDK